jgi:uncharacterized repeat protein (TIGR03803 family)
MKTFRTACVLAGFLLLALSLPAQTFTTLLSFDFTDGAIPEGQLVQGTDGNFYGISDSQGLYGEGTVFKMTPGGTLTTLYNFCPQTLCTDGAAPVGGLVQDTNGYFYGTTLGGGANEFYGTVFKIVGNTLTTLYSFCPPPYTCTDGESPSASLLQASDGNLYGTTVEGGAYGYGTIFKITPSGGLTTFHSFNDADGYQPYGTLIQATDGNFYGTTSLGGANGYGTVFKITLGGMLTTLHSFNLTDGYAPTAGLVQATNGNFYGTTYGGGASGFGTVFEITPAGVLNSLHSFDGLDGTLPNAGLIQATDGNFYGTTSHGANSYGTVFKITASGSLTTLHSFDGTDGDQSYAALLQATNGKFYGTTSEDGADDAGTVFSLSVGLGPFVTTRPTFATVGSRVVILGTNLTGATSVTFNGTPILFTVVSSSEIATSVPVLSTTGFVNVVTPSGTLTSNQEFRITPQIQVFSPPSGPVGTSVTIIGASYDQTTKVTFGGVEATTFTVDTDYKLTAIVPTGAVTGKIAITTAGGTATSPTSFTVTPTT